MGASLIRFYQDKITLQQKLAFRSAMIAGVLVHMYKFTNTLPNHDSLFNYYSSQNIVSLGRWFLSVACGFSSYFDLPWVIGLISLFFMACTALLITDIFRIQNPVLTILSAALLVSFPAITETFFFGFTADGYMLSMLFAALTVYCSTLERQGRHWIALSVVFICLSCGTYQAYVSFALVLALCYFMCELLENRYDTGQYLKWMGKQFFIYASGLLLYLVIWKICLTLQGCEPTAYEGISILGQLNIRSLCSAVYKTMQSLIMFFFGWNILKYGLTWYAGLNCLFLLLTCFSILYAIIHSGILKRVPQLLLFLLCAAVIPFAAFIWYFTSPSVIYYTRMEQSLCLCFIFIGVICEKWLRSDRRWITAILLAAIAFNNGIIANKFYYYMNLCYERSYATALEVQTRIHMVDDGSIKAVAFIGYLEDEFSDEFSKDRKGLGSMGVLKSPDKNLTASGSSNMMLFLLQYTGFELEYYHRHPDEQLPEIFFPDTDPVPTGWSIEFPLADAVVAEQLAATEEVQAMGIWPAADSIRPVGDVVVIKLSD